MLIPLFKTGVFYLNFLLPGLFPIEVFIAVSLLLSKSPRRSRFGWRYAAAWIAIAAYTLFVPGWGIPGAHFLVNVLLGYSVKFLIVLALCFFCFNVRIPHLMLVGTLGFCAQNLADNIVNGVMTFVRSLSFVTAQVVYVLLVVCVLSAVYFTMYFAFMHRTGGEISVKLSSVRMVLFLIMTLFVSNFLNMFINGALMAGQSTTYVTLGHLAMIFCNLLIIVLQMNFLMTDKMTRELDTIHSLWEKDRKTYEIGKEKMEALNLNLHDLRHLINRAKGATAEEVKAELEASVQEFGALIETGCNALDVVVNEKRRVCDDRGIELTIIADGRALNFMNDVDVYSMFGNILDNAIDAVSKFSDPDKKTVSLSVSCRNGNVIIREDNYCDYRIGFNNGLPMTTKKNKAKHGYGVKSIAMLAQKYGGAYSFSVHEEIFSLEISVPLPAAKPLSFTA